MRTGQSFSHPPQSGAARTLARATSWAGPSLGSSQYRMPGPAAGTSYPLPGLGPASVTTTSLNSPDVNYVGEGRGAYEVEHNYTYKFVGEGRGSFDLGPPTGGCWRWCNSKVLLCCLLPAALLCLFLYLHWVLTSLGGASPGDVHQHFRHGGHAVHAHAQSWLEWAKEQLGWKPLKAPDPVVFDCAAGYWNWQAAWSWEKKDWCCEQHGVGCPIMATTSPDPGTTQQTTSQTYDCWAGYADSAVGWSVQKKRWCCLHGGRGCPPAATTVVWSTTQAPPPAQPPPAQLPPTTQPEQPQQQPTQPSQQPPAEGPVPTDTPSGGGGAFDCGDAEDWERRWQDEQKNWCCAFQGVGCPAAATSPQAAPAATKAPTTAPTTAAPASSSPSAETTSAHEEYDCQADLDLASVAWADEKKKWCCEKRALGCTPAPSRSTAVAPYDCVLGLDGQNVSWSEEKHTWCCAHANAGCVASESEDLD